MARDAQVLLLCSLPNRPLPNMRPLFMQPERLTEFEKWFSHEFAVPVPAAANAAGRHTTRQHAGRPSSGMTYVSSCQELA